MMAKCPDSFWVHYRMWIYYVYTHTIIKNNNSTIKHSIFILSFKHTRSRKEKGYKGMGEQRRRARSQGKRAEEGAVPHLADRGWQN